MLHCYVTCVVVNENVMAILQRVASIVELAIWAVRACSLSFTSRRGYWMQALSRIIRYVLIDTQTHTLTILFRNRGTVI